MGEEANTETPRRRGRPPRGANGEARTADLRSFAEAVATLCGELSARITNLELSIKARSHHAKQGRDGLHMVGSFSHEAFDSVVSKVRGELLALVEVVDVAVDSESDR